MRHSTSPKAYSYEGPLGQLIVTNDQRVYRTRAISRRITALTDTGVQSPHRQLASCKLTTPFPRNILAGPVHCHRISLALFAALLIAGGSQATATREKDSAVLLAAVSPCEGEPEILLATTLSTDVGEETPEHKAARLSLDQWYSEALTNLHTRNSVSVPLPKEFACSKFKVVALSAIGSTHFIDWKRVHRLFPGVTGVLQISLPGYNRDRDRAIVEITMACGLQCGSDYLVQLRKTDGKWKRMRRVESATQ